MNIYIKRAKPEDALVISRIYAASWKVAYQGIVPQQYLDEIEENFREARFQNWLTNKEVRADLLYLDHIPAGCVAYGKAREEQFADWGEIVSIYVHPDFYRQGYGIKLLNTALQNLKAEGYHDCYLWAFLDNQNARQFYEAHGFVATTDTFQSVFMGKQLTDIRYRYHFDITAE
jgi:diamine N-acetyltransferase